MTVIPFSQALRELPGSSHGDGEGATFMKDLMTGKGCEDYIALVAQHFFIYEAIEAAAAAAADPVAARSSPAAHPPPAIEDDLAYLLGPTARAIAAAHDRGYAARVNEIAAEGWAGDSSPTAHPLPRRPLRRPVIRTLMQRQFGFETNGVGFYLFDQIAKPKEFKETYRDQLDAVEWDAVERERVIDEVLTAYRFNTELFLDLSAAKAAA